MFLLNSSFFDFVSSFLACVRDFNGFFFFYTACVVFLFRFRGVLRCCYSVCIIFQGGLFLLWFALFFREGFHCCCWLNKMPDVLHALIILRFSKSALFFRLCLRETNSPFCSRRLKEKILQWEPWLAKSQFLRV